MAINNELEEAFLELREENTKYSIRVLELEKELQATREQLDKAEKKCYYEKMYFLQNTI